MSSSTGHVARPPSSPGGGPDAGPKSGPVRRLFAARLRRPIAGGDRPPPAGGNGYATAALVTGVLGAALITILVSLACGVAGLVRAGRGGPGAPGKVRSWLGIGLALGWAVTAVFLGPRIVRAADPGCVAYKGPALGAYQGVIDDFRAGADGAATSRDLAVAIRQLDGAAAQSRSHAAAGSLTALSAQLQTVLSDVQARRPVPRAVVLALNRDSARADRACGTVRL